MAELSEAMVALAALAPAEEPPLTLRERVLERVRKEPRAAGDATGSPLSPQPSSPSPAPPVQTWKRWQPSVQGRGLTFVPHDAADWEPTGVAGVLTRRLFVDVPGDRVTMLVRMEPGTAYPPHRHANPEECFVLEGDLDTGAVHLRAGDYRRAEGGSVHGWQSTERGCTLLIVSSLKDELLEAGA